MSRGSLRLRNSSVAFVEFEKLTVQAVSELHAEFRLRDVGCWWRRWYMSLGHKRLGRILLSLSRERDATDAKRAKLVKTLLATTETRNRLRREAERSGLI